MDPHLILRVAESLSQQNGPAYFRSAISRAYYATYNVAVDLLMDMGVTETTLKAKFHLAVQRLLLGSCDDELIKVGSKLGTFHTDRERADYRMKNTSTESKRAADAAVLLAKDLIDAIDQCASDAPRRDKAKAKVLAIKV